MHATIRRVTRQRMRVAWRPSPPPAARIMRIFRNILRAGVVRTTDTAIPRYHHDYRHHDPVVRALRDGGSLATVPSRRVSRICRKFRVSNKSTLGTTEKIPFHRSIRKLAGNCSSPV